MHYSSSINSDVVGDIMNGHGLHYRADGSTVRYQCIHFVQRHANLQFSQYEGQFANGLPNGFGTKSDPKGTHLSCEWVAGLPCKQSVGNAVLAFKDGRRYKGQVRGGTPWGNGRIEWPDGSV